MFCFLSQILGLVPFSLKETEEPLVLQQDLKGGIDRDLERNVFGITEITKTLEFDRLGEYQRCLATKRIAHGHRVR
jgi:hypothetical protein